MRVLLSATKKPARTTCASGLGVPLDVRRESTGPPPEDLMTCSAYCRPGDVGNAISRRSRSGRPPECGYFVGGEGQPVVARPRARRRRGELGRASRPRWRAAHRVLALDLPGHGGSAPLARREPAWPGSPTASRGVLERSAAPARSSSATRSAVSSRCGWRSRRPDLVRGLLLVRRPGSARRTRARAGARRRRHRVDPAGAARRAARAAARAAGRGSARPSSGRCSSRTPLRSRERATARLPRRAGASTRRHARRRPRDGRRRSARELEPVALPGSGALGRARPAAAARRRVRVRAAPARAAARRRRLRPSRDRRAARRRCSDGVRQLDELPLEAEAVSEVPR